MVLFWIVERIIRGCFVFSFTRYEEISFNRSLRSFIESSVRSENEPSANKNFDFYQEGECVEAEGDANAKEDDCVEAETNSDARPTCCNRRRNIG